MKKGRINETRNIQKQGNNFYLMKKKATKKLIQQEL